MNWDKIKSFTIRNWWRVLLFIVWTFYVFDKSRLLRNLLPTFIDYHVKKFLTLCILIGLIAIGYILLFAANSKILIKAGILHVGLFYSFLVFSALVIPALSIPACLGFLIWIIYLLVDPDELRALQKFLLTSLAFCFSPLLFIPLIIIMRPLVSCDSNAPQECFFLGSTIDREQLFKTWSFMTLMVIYNLPYAFVSLLGFFWVRKIKKTRESSLYE